MGSRRSNLLFRWFVGLIMDDPVWDVTVFTKNPERLRRARWRWPYFNAVLDQARTHDLLPRALHRRRYPGRGVGFAQVLRAQGGGTGGSAR